MKRSNCLFYCLIKFIKHGGYIAIRKSDMGWFPHFIWVKDLKNADIEHYVPLEYREGYKKKIHKLIFEGKVKREDKSGRPKTTRN